VESRASPFGSSGLDGRDPRLSTIKVPQPLENDFDGELHFARRGPLYAAAESLTHALVISAN
jgi:hypothetical protein